MPGVRRGLVAELTQRRRGSLHGMHAAKGQVVFINSGAGLNARAGWSQYAMTKFALRALADALREEVKSKGVRVMTVYLSLIHI